MTANTTAAKQNSTLGTARVRNDRDGERQEDETIDPCRTVALKYHATPHF